jgi:hypothetical protein
LVRSRNRLCPMPYRTGQSDHYLWPRIRTQRSRCLSSGHTSFLQTTIHLSAAHSFRVVYHDLITTVVAGALAGCSWRSPRVRRLCPQSGRIQGHIAGSRCVMVLGKPYQVT